MSGKSRTFKRAPPKPKDPPDDVCYLCRGTLPDGPRSKLKPLERLVHKSCAIEYDEWIQEHWDSLPEVMTWRK